MKQMIVGPGVSPSRNRSATAIFLALGMTAVYIFSAFVRVHLRHQGFTIER